VPESELGAFYARRPAQEEVLPEHIAAAVPLTSGDLP